MDGERGASKLVMQSILKCVISACGGGPGPQFYEFRLRHMDGSTEMEEYNEKVKKVFKLVLQDILDKCVNKLGEEETPCGPQ